ncbi:pyridoxamine 5'-phosphate oxidase [Coprinopsis marcescibilis]|uniref:pyridoxal 5'-phosphate synthase n=1 Tax=Coprinopsis marcescibilis TaxID=230819 RepID=A0A5C3L5R8_COPMA|nr:pyridoxamine 5'-phosphate oxidase [Coprinopsis marcescibilis]
MNQEQTILAQPAPETIQVVQHQQYQTSDHLTPTNVVPSPLDQFRQWFKEAVEKRVQEPEAVTLSTATSRGVPSARIVLLKQVDNRGFVFFTNYTSRKSQEMIENPHAALAFYWREIHRSVRVVGRVEQLSKEENDEYFQSRPVGSRLGAWASKQSQTIQEGDLDARLLKVQERFGSQDGAETHVPTPEFWGGWRVIPEEVEFWSGKPSRLHDRIRYLRTNSDSVDAAPEWKIERLSP